MDISDPEKFEELMQRVENINFSAPKDAKEIIDNQKMLNVAAIGVLRLATAHIKEQDAIIAQLKQENEKLRGIAGGKPVSNVEI